ncbi:MAG: hypothetical protein KF768_10270 [Phycisphaeraceae bacterium]|nr:hypothetical protein [Phycisphaeraceae bacterium]
MSIRLRKWYLDAVDPGGRAVIVNWATLRIAGAGLSAASVLDSRGGQTLARTTLHAGTEPVIGTNGLEWSNPRLGVSGVWRTLQHAEPVRLLGDDRRGVLWRPSIVAAEVNAVVCGVPLVGVGYAESLELSVAPWALPIFELRWGRFVTERASVVWLDWRGDHPLRLVLIDGQVRAHGLVSDDFVEADGMRVRLTESRVLREGPIGTTALSGVPGLQSTAPAAWLGSIERKALARASMESVAGRSTGWAIHEVVRFGSEDCDAQARPLTRREGPA